MKNIRPIERFGDISFTCQTCQLPNGGLCRGFRTDAARKNFSNRLLDSRKTGSTSAPREANYWGVFTLYWREVETTAERLKRGLAK